MPVGDELREGGGLAGLVFYGATTYRHDAPSSYTGRGGKHRRQQPSFERRVYNGKGAGLIGACHRHCNDRDRGLFGGRIRTKFG